MQDSLAAALVTQIALRLERKLHWDGRQELFAGAGSEEANRMLVRPYRAPWKLDGMPA